MSITELSFNVLSEQYEFSEKSLESYLLYLANFSDTNFYCP